MDRSGHFLAMLAERAIEEEWIEQALLAPDRIDNRGDGTRHYLKQIPERDHRWLRVVVNMATQPPRAVTAFFDRRLKRAP